MKPSRTGGGHSAHFDGALGLSTSMKSGFIDVEVPGHSKWSCRSRCLLLAHDLLAQRGAVDGEKGAQNYRTHEVVTREQPYSALPLAVYPDGVALLRTDSCLAVWVMNLVTERRHLVATLRKPLRVSRMVLALDRLPVFGVAALSHG